MEVFKKAFRAEEATREVRAMEFPVQPVTQTSPSRASQTSGQVRIHLVTLP